MSRDIALLLVGAAIAIASSIVTAIVQHRLSLRAERIKRKWEKEERESQEMKKRLAEGAQVQRKLVDRKIENEISSLGLFRKEAGDPENIEDKEKD